MDEFIQQLYLAAMKAACLLASTLVLLRRRKNALHTWSSFWSSFLSYLWNFSRNVWHVLRDYSIIRYHGIASLRERDQSRGLNCDFWITEKICDAELSSSLDLNSWKMWMWSCIQSKKREIMQRKGQMKCLSFEHLIISCSCSHSSERLSHLCSEWEHMMWHNSEY